MRYEGAWRRGRRQGQGTEWYPSGEEYTGALSCCIGCTYAICCRLPCSPFARHQAALPALHGVPSGVLLGQTLRDGYSVLGLGAMASMAPRP